jgi:hypothetical protein
MLLDPWHGEPSATLYEQEKDAGQWFPVIREKFM